VQVEMPSPLSHCLNRIGTWLLNGGSMVLSGDQVGHDATMHGEGLAA